MVRLSSGPRLFPGYELVAAGGMFTAVTQLPEQFQPTLGFMFLSSGLAEVEEQRT